MLPQAGLGASAAACGGTVPGQGAASQQVAKPAAAHVSAETTAAAASV
jgi:hypothetical protein